MPRVSKLKQSKRAVHFNSTWAPTLGLFVTNRNPNNIRVVAVACKLCTTFGCELPTQPNACNRYATTVKRFKLPFRTDNFRNHLNCQHCIKWADYLKVSAASRESFFDVVAPYTEAILSHFGDLRCNAMPTMKRRCRRGRFSEENI